MKRLLIAFLAVWGALVPAAAQDDGGDKYYINRFDYNSTTALKDEWWDYADEGSTFKIESEEGALKLTADLSTGGYAGLGYALPGMQDFSAGSGLTFKYKQEDAGDLTVTVRLHMKDPTQTGPDMTGVSPFGAPFDAEDSNEWYDVFVHWDSFERLTWLGEEGSFELDLTKILQFEIAFNNNSGGPASGIVWFDDVAVADLSAEDVAASQPTYKDIVAPIAPIQVSRQGYRPQDPKFFNMIAVDGTEPTGTFSVVDAVSGDVAHEGEIVPLGYDSDTGEDVWRGTFTDLEEPGTYKIVTGIAESWTFEIAEDALVDSLELAARAFYLWRSGIDIDDEVSGLSWKAGHLEPARPWGEPDAEGMDVRGGWYDAGDYGRYITPSAFTLGMMSWGYMANPGFFADATWQIPESDNGVPDLLDEMRYELEWMMRMQRDDGLFYHKVTTANWGSGLPAQDTQDLWLLGPSSEATASAVATLARMVPLYEPYDAEFAAQMRESALAGWAWLQENPDQFPAGGFRNPPAPYGQGTAGYPYAARDEYPHRLWAAAELFRTTGEEVYHDAFKALWPEIAGQSGRIWSTGWPDPTGLMMFAYIKAAGADDEIRQTMIDDAVDWASGVLDKVDATAYDTAITGREYVWGSTHIALLRGLMLMEVNAVAPDPRYVEAAYQQVQYVLAVNPLGQLYFTGLGEGSILFPHHRQSWGAGQAVPGLIGEGANIAGGDSTVETFQRLETPPGRAFLDAAESYATNEPTIYGNGAYVGLAAWFVPSK